jgi:O-antigen/teichoic acid export membrane protein
MNREKSLVKNTIIIGFGTFLPKFASLITLPIVTGDLTKAEYGTYDLLLILVSLVLPLATLQIQCAAFRFLVQIREDEEKCSNVISNIIWFTLGMSVLPLIVIFFMLGKYGVWTRVVICLYFLFDIILQTLQQVVRGLGKNGMYSVSTVLNSLLNMLMIVVLVRVFNMGLVGVVGSMVVANSITSAYLMLKSGIIRYISISRLSWYMIKEMIAYSWPLIPNNLSSWIMTLSDRLILAFFGELRQMRYMPLLKKYLIC